MSKFSSKGPSQRQLRVGEQVRHALAELIGRGEIRNKMLERSVVSISEVAMSPDLKIATAYISLLGDSDGEAIVKAMAKNAKFIRGRLTPALRQMKHMPDFRFRLDTSFDNFDRIERLLRAPEVARDLGHDDEKDT